MDTVDIPHLLATKVAPWVTRWEHVSGHPLATDTSEGYTGLGSFGARSGPMSSLDFSNVAHEMAHALERVEAGRSQALATPDWGLRIKSSVTIMGRIYLEPQTAQASRREARVVGIQQRILEMVGHPKAADIQTYMAHVLMEWMPDYFLGGDTPEARRQDRLDHMQKAYERWTAERVLNVWNQAMPFLLAQQSHRPCPSTSFPRAPR